MMTFAFLTLDKVPMGAHHRLVYALVAPQPDKLGQRWTHTLLLLQAWVLPHSCVCSALYILCMIACHVLCSSEAEDTKDPRLRPIDNL